jgi:FixJ family two-component response regulator
VSSTIGKGTTVSIWLPVSGEVSSLATVPSEALPQGHGETVMIVDDEQALMSLAEEIVAGLGYEPIGFASSNAALAAFRAAPDRFDAVLTDESMPELVGTELAREIRRLRPSLPILLMSGHGDASLIARARAAGVGEVLHKPLHAHEIAQALGRLLGTAR